MSNYLAIATVTAGLVQVLQPAVEADVPGAKVTKVRPDGSGNGTPDIGVNLYLYQITPNAAFRNADLPTRDSNGDLVQRPRAALDLHYLLTFYGDENRFEPQLVLGSVVRTMHAQPVLTREVIRAAKNANPELAKSNLEDEVELVKFSPIILSLEELSKLWSVFFQIPYTLSVAYQGSVVLIESEETPRAVLPVRQRNLYVMTFRQPLIEEVRSQEGENQPIVVGETLLVLGQRLRGDDTQLRVAGIEVTPAEVTDTQISVPLSEPPFPDGSLRAGVQGVQVVHRLLLGTPPVPHHGFESNVAPFVLRPTLKRTNGEYEITVSNVQGSGDAPRSADVTVTVDPKIDKEQRVILLLNEVTDESPEAYTFFVERRANYVITEQVLEDLESEGVPQSVLNGLKNIENKKFNTEEEFLDEVKAAIGETQAKTFKVLILRYAGPQASSNSVTIPISGVEAADYLVRVQVDGAESILEVDEDPDSPTYNQYIGPKVTIP